MRASTLLATLRKLGIAASFTRPRVSDDNPISEALFRSLKYRPEYPAGGSGDLGRFALPADAPRHTGREGRSPEAEVGGRGVKGSVDTAPTERSWLRGSRGR
jgi:transposase InsO family protein